MEEDVNFLQMAIQESTNSVMVGGFPAGAVLVLDGVVIGRGISDGKNRHDATSHAEVEAIRAASVELHKRDLKGSVVYASMEPCLMCFSASYWAGVSRIVYACRKKRLSKMHYEGLHDLDTINQNNNRSMDIVHLQGLEEEALRIIRDWEAHLSNVTKR